ncbi:radical SAM/SPASM family putative metalloenzyme maturase [Desulfobulbus rhabdoformis]|uniref:radical SAM/SPASM family putative metalloenzyme maturase n=1 Tax=Desulfobulbus rhabdoformis TaxID=34032 RepID=UPI0019668FE8|nr:radical SAM/SPASM family putative metalloenzyme maturase [Desulfobulbus rhabdoformis]MBM9616803.1 radical SAM/SPASM family putative metalloenzyme maturase [Desulfobulbus rhabdoformis]
MNAVKKSTDLLPSAPRKLYIETTTRCNLRCKMCMKYAQGSCIEEGDFDLKLFHRLIPSLAQVDFLVLNGIGEPLLHPQLATMIALAREAMPHNGSIGFQSNGLLFTQKKTRILVAAGLDTVCLSVDSLQPAQGGEHQASPVERAIGYLQEAGNSCKRSISLGIEIVLRESNQQQLPQIIDWAHARGVDYIIASHLFSYDGQLKEETLFTPNSLEATALFAKWSQQAEDNGLNLASLPRLRLRFNRSNEDRQLLDLGANMQLEARERDIKLHFDNLLKQRKNARPELVQLWEEAKQLANERGIRLNLPPLQAPSNDKRSCPFMEEKAAFITTNGDVMPCHFLWHTYSCMVNQGDVQIHSRPFGNLAKQSLQEIWEDRRYTLFRQEASGSDYAPCWSCSSGPCPDLVNPNMLDIHDCYGNHVPCGHCMWSIGWTRCL